MKILSIDPAGGLTGISIISLENDALSLAMTFLLKSPEEFNSTQKNNYIGHCIAALIGQAKPDVVVSEKIFGLGGYGGASLNELMGSIKAQTLSSITWQGISETRRGVIGDGHGASTKAQSAEWILNYPWGISAKRKLKQMLSEVKVDSNEGYDILDSILHGLYYMIDNNLIKPVHKPAKIKRSKKNVII